MGNDTDLNNLAMSEDARPLLDALAKHIRENVDPITEEFHRLGEGRAERFSYAPGQLELLETAKNKAREAGLWNFFLPNAETGEGLSNLDYAYIAFELGKNPLASQTLNCSAPDTGNMEVLERVGTPEQKEKWLKPLLNGEIRSCFGMTEPQVASSDARNIETSAVLDGDDWVINGEKYYISGAGDPRCKIMICMVKTSRTPPACTCWARCVCSATTTRPTATCTSSWTTCACRKKTFCGAKVAALKSPSCAWARGASTTACVPSVPPKKPWT